MADAAITVVAATLKVVETAVDVTLAGAKPVLGTDEEKEK